MKEELRENSKRMMQKMDEHNQSLRDSVKKWGEKIDDSHRRLMEKLEDQSKIIDNVNKKTEEKPNDKTRGQVVLLSEIKPDKKQENIKRREMESKKMRRMHPRNLIKTQEKYEMMNNGLISVLNIPMTNDKEIRNSRDYRRRLKVISIMTYHKTIVYNLERTRDKWEIPEIKIRGKLSMISLVIHGPETYGKKSVI